MNLECGLLLGMGFAAQAPVVEYTQVGGDRPHCHRQVLEGTPRVGNAYKCTPGKVRTTPHSSHPQQ